jgi:outer membrane protein TolC
MLHCFRRFGAALFFGLLATATAAQQGLTLAEAQGLAVARSQSLVANDAAAAALREQAVAAGQLPDPVLKLGVENVPLSGPDRFSLSRDSMTMRRIGLMQELTRSDKRQLRVERVEKDRARVQAERAEATATVQRETALAWIERHYTLSMAELARRQLQEAQLEAQAAEIAYSSGRGGQADLFAARAAVVSLRDKVLQTERQAQGAVLKLARWIGADQAGRATVGPVDWRQAAARELFVNDQIHRLPALQVLAAQVQAAETEVRLAQADRRPDWTLEAMYGQRGSGYPDMVSVGVSIPLPIARDRRQDREVAAKLASLAETRAKYEEAVRAQEADLRVLANDWEASKERSERLRADLLPAARLRTQAALTAYQTARGELAAVVAARREEVDAHMQVLQLEMETARLWAQLNYLVPDTRYAAGKEASQ